MRSQQDKDVDKAKRYASLRYTFSIAEVFYLSLLLFLFLKSGLSKSLALWFLKSQGIKPLVLPLYLFSLYLSYYVLSFPLNFYHSFLLEHKFSLSTQKFSGWFKDQLKNTLLSYIILLIVFSAFYFILSHFIHAWWLSISLFWIFFNIILTKLTPLLIIPLFFKYKKLLDENLRLRIFRLAEKMKVGVLDCFEIDFSSKTLKANAALTGLGRSRRVILADTLKDKYSAEEIEVILAHEFAHHRLKHIWKLLAMNSLAAFLCFYLIFISSDFILSFFNLPSLWDIASLPVLLLYFILLNLVLQPLANYISRRLEINADKMALAVTGSNEAFIS
ncbi:MAG TPA: M48 family metalloprotease, partial [Candidatus Margulisiibacteriota bacterium]|nr:M48 family metalloprotease [Candidatus Margulisiibacteriota bacterium]